MNRRSFTKRLGLLCGLLAVKPMQAIRALKGLSVPSNYDSNWDNSADYPVWGSRQINTVPEELTIEKLKKCRDIISQRLTAKLEPERLFILSEANHKIYRKALSK